MQMLDITYCFSDCTNRKCDRHLSHAREADEHRGFAECADLRDGCDKYRQKQTQFYIVDDIVRDDE